MPDLVGIGLAFRVLDIDARIASPRGFENDMAAAALPWLAKVSRADLVEFAEGHVGGLQAHLFEKFFEARHIDKYGATIGPKCQIWEA